MASNGNGLRRSSESTEDNASSGIICYLVETKEGFFRMNLPERYKLTLGPLVPGSKYNNGHSHLVLRVYDGTKQRAVFYNVEAFRDITLTILGEPHQTRRHLTALSPLQQRVVALLEFTPTIYTKLCGDSSEPP